MHIKKKSFSSDLPKIIQAINDADFLSIDAEFSGLGPGIDYIDNLQSRYGKVRAAANEYQLMQYGICAFKWDELKRVYMAKPFYAFLFPNNGKSFKSSPSSLAFLRKFNFDFNSWIDDGVPYLSLQDINAQKLKIDRLVYQKAALNEHDKEWVGSKIKEINDWLQHSNENNLKISNVNSYQRRLLYQTVPEETNGHVAVEASSEHNTILFKKLKDEDIVAVEDIQRKKSLRELESNIGFYKVMEAMVQAKKPIVV
jgi:poly(A)-specific ribonuclease